MVTKEMDGDPVTRDGTDLSKKEIQNEDGKLNPHSNVTTIFVGNLPFETRDEELEKEFSEIGPIKRAFIVKDKDKKSKSRGCGYVQFVLQEDAEKCVKESKTIGNRKLRLSFANKKPKHQKRKALAAQREEADQNGEVTREGGPAKKTKNIGKDFESAKSTKTTEPTKTIQTTEPTKTIKTTEPSEVKTSSQDGKTDLQKTIVLTGLTAKVKRKAFRILCEEFGEIENIVYPVPERDEVTAFVRFKDYKSAIRSTQKIPGRKVKKSGVLSACLLTKENKHPSKKALQKSRLIIRNLSFKCEENDLTEVFSKFGKVINVNIPKKKVNEKDVKIGCAFVQFANTENAKAALEGMNLKEIKERQVVVDWAVAKEVYKGKVSEENKKEEENKETSKQKKKKKAKDADDNTEDGEKEEENKEISKKKKTKNVEDKTTEDVKDVEDEIKEAPKKKKKKKKAKDVEDKTTEDCAKEEETEETPKQKKKKKAKNVEDNTAEDTDNISIENETTQKKKKKKKKMNEDVSTGVDVDEKAKKEEVKNEEEADLNAVESRTKISVSDDQTNGKKKKKKKERKISLSEDDEAEELEEEDLVSGDEDDNDSSMLFDDDDEGQDDDDDDDEDDDAADDECDDEDDDGISGDEDDDISGDDNDDSEGEDEDGKDIDVKPKPEMKDAKEGKTIFIRNLSYDVDEEMLSEEFEKYGAINYCKLVYDHASGRSKGTAFLKFKLKKSCDDCMDEFTKKEKTGVNTVIDGRPIMVSLAVTKGKLGEMERIKSEGRKETDKRNLYLAAEGIITRNSPAAEGLSDADFKKREKALAEKNAKLKNPNFFVSRTRLCVKNLPLTTDADAMRVAFLKHAPGQMKIKELKIMRSKDRRDISGMPRSLGFGFIELESHEDALAILRATNNNPSIFGEKRRPIVEFSVENAKALKILELKKKRIETKTTNVPEDNEGNKPKMTRKELKDKIYDKRRKRYARYKKKRAEKKLLKNDETPVQNGTVEANANSDKTVKIPHPKKKEGTVEKNKVNKNKLNNVNNTESFEKTENCGFKRKLPSNLDDPIKRQRKLGKKKDENEEVKFNLMVKQYKHKLFGDLSQPGKKKDSNRWFE